MSSSVARFPTEPSGLSVCVEAACGFALSFLFGLDGILISPAFVTGLLLIVEACSCIPAVRLRQLRQSVLDLCLASGCAFPLHQLGLNDKPVTAIKELGYVTRERA